MKIRKREFGFIDDSIRGVEFWILCEVADFGALGQGYHAASTITSSVST